MTIDKRLRRLEAIRREKEQEEDFKKNFAEVSRMVNAIRDEYNSPEAVARREEEYNLRMQWAQIYRNNPEKPEFEEYLVSVGFMTEAELRKRREEERYWESVLRDVRRELGDD